MNMKYKHDKLYASKQPRKLVESPIILTKKMKEHIAKLNISIRDR